MTNETLGRWLLVALAIVGLALAAPAVSAHGDEPVQGNETTADGMPADGDMADWTAWMTGQMAGHMGSDAVDEMTSHMGATVDGMAHGMTDGDHAAGGMNGRGSGC